MKNLVVFAAATAAIIIVGATFASRVVGSSGGAGLVPMIHGLPGIERVVAAGRTDSEYRELEKFDRLAVLGAGTVSIRRGDRPSVTVTGDAAVLPFVETKVSNGNLTLRVKSGVPGDAVAALHYVVTAASLSGLAVGGSANVNFEDPISGYAADIDIGGSGSVRSEVDVKDLEIAIGGSGDVILSGNVEKATVTIAGSGNVKAGSLAGKDAEIHILGSGDVEVGRFEDIDAAIAGSGDVVYEGTPKLTAKTLGSGKVRPK